VCEVEVETAASKKTEETTTAKEESHVQETLDEEQLVTFTLNGEEYGLDIQAVREIIRIPDLIKVPQAPDYVEGLISLRNKLVPLIDMRHLFNQTLVSEEQTTIVGQIREAQEKTETWLSELQASLQAENADSLKVQTFPLKNWNHDFAAELERVQLALEKVDNLASTIDEARVELTNAPFNEAVALVNSKLIPLTTRLTELFNNAVSETENNDEQRVVVTDANGLIIGLIVDMVNEVKRVEKRLIDPPPSLSGDEERQQVKGVAKLDEGKRLIMILDNENLVDIHALSELTEKHEKQAGKAAKTEAQDEEEDETRSLQQQALEEEQLVTFRLDKEEFGIRIMQIQEINRLEEVTKVPRTPDFVAGVTNLRGTVVPVIDLRTRFGMEIKEVDDRTRVVIIDLDGKKTGLIVDQVHEVLRLLKADIEPPPEVVSADETNEFIDGIGKLEQGKRMLVLLNVAKILTSSEKKQLAKVGSESSDAPKKAPAKTTASKKTTTRKTLKKAEE